MTIKEVMKEGHYISETAAGGNSPFLVMLTYDEELEHMKSDKTFGEIAAAWNANKKVVTIEREEEEGEVTYNSQCVVVNMEMCARTLAVVNSRGQVRRYKADADDEPVLDI